MGHVLYDSTRSYSLPKILSLYLKHPAHSPPPPYKALTLRHYLDTCRSPRTPPGRHPVPRFRGVEANSACMLMLIDIPKELLLSRDCFCCVVLLFKLLSPYEYHFLYIMSGWLVILPTKRGFHPIHLIFLLNLVVGSLLPAVVLPV